MKIKSLKLHGFKSFPDQVTIDLSSTFTALAGPNGSGKSNIVDAIKWVLGSQSPKSLRGSKMEDVIFKGSKHRKPLGFAKAELVIDNEDGEIPVDYSEVAIGRKLYRTGESQYLINGEEVRLKDIRELLYDTGIGVENYSLIEQGKISKLLDASPEECRELIEEAAGISTFQARKKEALRQMDGVQSDLNRIQDLLNELESDIHGLKTQAGKAKKYQSTKEELEQKKKLRLFLEYEKLRECRNELRSRLKEKQQEKQELKEQLQTLVKKGTSIESSFESLQDRIRETEKQISERTHKIEPLEKKITDLEEQLDEIRKSKDDLEDIDLENTRNEIDKIEEEIETRQNEKQNIKEQIRKKQSERETLQQRVTSREEHLEEVKKHIQELEKTKQNTSKGIDETKKQLEEINQKIRNQRKRKSKIEQDLQEVREKYGRKTEEKSQLQEKIQKNRDEITSLSEKQSDLETQREQTRERISSFESEIDSTQDRLRETRAELETLQNLEVDQTGIPDDPKNVIETIRNKSSEPSSDPDQKFPGILGNLLEISTSHPVAIQSFLQPFLSYIVVEDWETAERTLEIAERTEANIGILVLSAIPSGQNASKHSFQTERHLSSDDDRVIHLVDWLLGLYPQHSSRSSAKQDSFSPEQNGPGHPDQLLFTDSGFIQYRGQQNIRQNPLERRNKIQSLEHREEELEANIQQLKQKKKEERSRKKSLENQLDEIKDQIHDKKGTVQEQKNRIQLLDSKIDRLQENEQNLQDEVTEIQEETQKLTEKHQHLQEFLTSSQSRLEEVEQELRTAEKNRETRKQQLREAREALQDLQLTLKELNEKKRHTEDLLKDKKRYRKQQQQRIQRYKNQIETLNERQESKENELKKTRNKKQQSRKKRETLTEKRDELEEKLKKKNEKRQNIENKRDRISKEFEDCKEDVLELEMKCKSRKEEQKKKERQIFESVLQSTETPVKSAEDLSDSERKQVQNHVENHLQSNRPETSLEQLKEDIRDLQVKLESMGKVNLAAIDQLEQKEQRRDELQEERDDLEDTRNTLQNIIDRTRKKSRERFQNTLEEAEENFNSLFRKIFGGGKAQLKVQKEEDEKLLECGVDIMVRLPGKEKTNLSLLSGGEKAMTSISLMMSLFMTNPGPLCILDEVDAPLDESNLDQFLGLIDEFSDSTQFLLITHQKKSIASAEMIYGITMEEEGISKLVPLELEENIPSSMTKSGSNGTVESHRQSRNVPEPREATPEKEPVG